MADNLQPIQPSSGFKLEHAIGILVAIVVFLLILHVYSYVQLMESAWVLYKLDDEGNPEESMALKNAKPKMIYLVSDGLMKLKAYLGNDMYFNAVPILGSFSFEMTPAEYDFSYNVLSDTMNFTVTDKKNTFKWLCKRVNLTPSIHDKFNYIKTKAAFNE